MRHWLLNPTYKKGTVETHAGFQVRVYAAVVDMLCYLPLLIYVLAPVRTIEVDLSKVNAKLTSGEYTQAEYRMAIKDLQIATTVTEFVISSVTDYLLFGVLAVIFWLKYQASPGKLLLGLRIQNAKNGAPPALGQLILRYVAYLISAIPLMAGFFAILFTDKKRGWHDMIAGTEVVYKVPIDDKVREKKFKRDTIIMFSALILFLAYLLVRQQLER